MKKNSNNLGYYLNLRSMAGIRSVAPACKYLDGQEQSEAYGVSINNEVYLWGCEMAALSGDCIKIEYKSEGQDKFYEIKSPLYQDEYTVDGSLERKIYGSPNIPININSNASYYEYFYNNEIAVKEVSPYGSNDSENVFVEYGPSSPIQVLKQNFIRCFKFLKTGTYKISLVESSSALYRQIGSDFVISDPDAQYDYEEYTHNTNGPWVPSGSSNAIYKKFIKKEIIIKCYDGFDFISNSEYSIVDYDIGAQANYDALYIDSISTSIYGPDIIISGKNYTSLTPDGVNSYIIGIDGRITGEFAIQKTDTNLGNHNGKLAYNLRNKIFEGILFSGPAHFGEMLKVGLGDLDYAIIDLRCSEFNNCTFSNIIFGSSVIDYLILDGCKFVNCKFNNCTFYINSQNLAFIKCNINNAINQIGFLNFKKSDGNIVIGCSFENTHNPISFHNVTFESYLDNMYYDNKNNIFIFNSIIKNNLIDSKNAFISVLRLNDYSYSGSFSGNIVLSNYASDVSGSFFSISSTQAYANIVNHNVSGSIGELGIGVSDSTDSININNIENRITGSGSQIQSVPIVGSSDVDWFQNSNYGIQSQFSGFDVVLWYNGRVSQIPGAVSSYPAPSEIYSNCSVCTLGSLGCDQSWDGANNFYRRFQYGAFNVCGGASSTTLQQVRNDFKSYFDIDKMVRNQARFRPDWILAFLKGGSEPLWWPTQIPGLTQWPIFADDGSASSSIGLAFNPLEQYKLASIKYKTRILAYFYPVAWVELNPDQYPFALNMFGNKISSPRHGNDTSERSIYDDNFVDILCKVHLELAQLGIDANSGYGVCGVMWDAALLSYQLDFSPSAKIKSGIDTSVDFPFPLTPGTDLYNFASTYASNGNVASLLLNNVNASIGWTDAVKRKLEAYVYALRSKEAEAMKTIRDYVDNNGYSNFVIIPGLSNSQFSFEWPMNSESSLDYSSGIKTEMGIEGIRYRRQPSGIASKNARDSAPDLWLAAYTDMIINQGSVGKRQYCWQIHMAPVYFGYGGACGSQIYSCLNSFDANYSGQVEFKSYIFPREMAVRGWLENQSLLALVSGISIEFMHNYLDWHKFDNPEDLNGFNNINEGFSIAHLPYQRRIYSILGSIKESNLVIKNRKRLTWCIIMHRPEYAWKSTIYNGYPGELFGSYYWLIFGAIHTCVEHGVPHSVVHDRTFKAADYSSAGVLIIPFSRSVLSQNVLDEINNFNGQVIWMQDEFVNGILVDNFHNTVVNGTETNSQIARNKLWDFMQAAVLKPSVSVDVNPPDNVINSPVPIVGYEAGSDAYGNKSIVASIVADASWHDIRKAYLFDQTYNNDPTQGVDYCGRQNLLYDQPNSNIRIEAVANDLGLRKVLDNCGECSSRDCFYVDYAGSDPMPVESLPARGKLVYYAGYPPTWDSLRNATVTFNATEKPYRARQLLLNKELGRFDPIDYYINSDSFNLVPFEMGSIVQFQLKDANALNKDLGICINLDLLKVSSSLDLSSVFSSIAANANAVNLIKVVLRCDGNVIEREVAGNIVFSELANHAFDNPDLYEWLVDDPCGIAAPSDQSPFGFIFASSSACDQNYLSISGIVIQNEGICNIASKLPSLRAFSIELSGIPCECGSGRPSKLYSSRASISLEYAPEDGGLWAQRLSQEISGSSNSIDGLMLFIKPVTDTQNRYYNLDSNGNPYYRGIINYLQDVDSAISDYSNGAQSIYDYYYGIVIDFSSNFDINNNSPHPRYCAYPNTISILNSGDISGTQAEIASINGAYIDLIREIKFSFSDIKVSIRGLGNFGNGLSLESQIGDTLEYSLLDYNPLVRINLEKRISESYGPLLEKCDFLYVENQNTVRGDSYRISVMRVNVLVSAIRNHFLAINGICPELYLEASGVFSGNQDPINENYCEINNDEILAENIQAFYKYGINGYVYNAVQETIAVEVFSNCPISVNNNEYYQKLASCWLSTPFEYQNLTLSVYRYINLSGQTTVTLNSDNSSISSIRRESPFSMNSYQNVLLQNTGKSTMILRDNSYVWATIDYGFPSQTWQGVDFNYPSPLDLENGIDGSGRLEWSLQPKFLDLNKSYHFFLNDPYPDNVFENTLPDGSSMFLSKPLYNKYALFDEVSNSIIDNIENKIAITGVNFCSYLNENNSIVFKMGGKVKAIGSAGTNDNHWSWCFTANPWNPLILCCSSLQHYKEYVAQSLQSNSLDFTSYYNGSIDVNWSKINYFNNLSYHAINTGKDLFMSYQDVRFLHSIDELNSYKNTAITDLNLKYDTFNSFNYVDYEPVDSVGSKYATHKEFFNNFINSFSYIESSNLFNQINPAGNNLAIISSTYSSINESGFKDFIINSQGIKSIKCRSNCLVSLDSEGSLTITYQPEYGYGNFKFYLFLFDIANDLTNMFSYTDGMIAHYSKEELETNFWIDSDGLVSYIANKDFVDVEIYGEHVLNSLPSLTYVYALHKNGKLYARELNSCIKNTYSDRLICKLKFAESLVAITPDIIGIDDVLYISAHDTFNIGGPTRFYEEDQGTARWVLIAIDYATGYAVLECQEGYVGDNANLRRPFKIYKNDLLRKVGSINEFIIEEKYFENAWSFFPIISIPPDSLEALDVYPADFPKNFRISYSSKMQKISPLSEDGVTLNPDFMTLNIDSLKVDNVFLTNRLEMCLIDTFAGKDYVLTSDPHKKIFIWENSNKVSERFVLSPAWGAGQENRFLRLAVPRVNGIFHSLQMGLRQIDASHKVVKILANNNIGEDTYYGVSPVFVVKTNDQNNKEFSNSDGVFYSYSYELAIFDSIGLWGDPFVDFSKYSILNKYKKEKVFGITADGSYTQIGWNSIENADFNQSFYDNFIYKNVTLGMSYPPGFNKYYCPIRCGSTGIKSLVLVNNDGDCCVINSHVISYDPSNANNMNYRYRNAIRGFNDYNIENQYFDLLPFRQYWLYNTGPGFVELKSGLPSGITFNMHEVTFVHRNVYKNASDGTIYSTPYVYNIIDNSLVSPIVHEETTYGLGNSPSNASNPFGYGLNAQQLDDFKTFSYTGSSDIHDISKDENYIEVINYVNFDGDGLITGKDAIIFKVKNNYDFKIDMAKADNFMLYVYYSNGVLDAANMGPNNYTHPVTFDGTTYYGRRYNDYTVYMSWFSVIMRETLASVVPSILRTPMVQ